MGYRLLRFRSWRGRKQQDGRPFLWTLFLCVLALPCRGGPIVFNKSIKVTFEHCGWMSTDENPDQKQHSWNERQDDFSSVAFWYQTGEPTFEARASHASERVLPNLDLIFPAAPLAGSEHHGPGASSVQKNLGVESLRLRERRPRVKEYAHERDKDWRENPVLHR